MASRSGSAHVGLSMWSMRPSVHLEVAATRCWPSRALRIMRRTESTSWTGAATPGPFDVIEEVVGLEGHGTALTALTCPSAVDEACQDGDENDEADLEGMWILRLRR